MPRFLRGVDDLILEVVGIGLASLIFFVISAKALNSATAHHLDSVPFVGPVVAGSRAAIDSIVS